MDAAEHSKTNKDTVSKRRKTADTDSDDGDGVFTHTNFPKFVIISPSDVNKPLLMISPFVLSKALQAAVGTLKSVGCQQNGNVLVETDNRTYSAKLLALTDIAGCPVQASAHRTLNSSKRVIKCADLKLCKKEEIIEELCPQGVVDSFNITVKS